MSTLHRPFWHILRTISWYRPLLVWIFWRKLGWNFLNILNNPMIKSHRYVSQGHPRNHIIHPFARILQIINNKLSPILTFACIKISLVAEAVDIDFGLTYVDKSKHRLLREMQYNMINIVAGCLLCQLICSSIVMSRYMSSIKATQGKFYI